MTTKHIHYIPPTYIQVIRSVFSYTSTFLNGNILVQYVIESDIASLTQQEVGLEPQV